MRISATDADVIAALLNPATEQIIALRTVDCEQALDAQLDAVTNHHGVVTLELRHINDACIAHGPTWTVALADVLYLHIW